MKAAKIVSLAATLLAIALGVWAVCWLVAGSALSRCAVVASAFALAAACLLVRCAVDCASMSSRRIDSFGEATRDFPEAMSWLDNRSRILTWNRGAQDMYGYAPEEMLGKPLSVLIPPDLLASGEIEWMNRQLHERGRLCSYQTRRRAKDGRDLLVEVTRTIIRDRRGRILGSSAVARDITHRREMEESLSKAERLASVGGLASKLAHEVRNPLTSMILNAEMLAQELGALPPERTVEARELLSSILAELRRTSTLLKDYLSMAKQGAEGRGPCDVAGVIQGLLAFVDGELMGRRIEVATHLAEPLPPVRGDERQLRQIFMNLLRNAIEAMPEGGKLTVEAAPAGGGVLVTVSDTGTGVPMGDEERVFEPFYSTKEQGTGLGLAIVKQVVRDHCGTVLCDHAEGGGARFKVWLPAEDGLA